MIDLSTHYLGLTLRSPLVCSAGPLCERLDNIRRMEDAGAGAVVLHSLFEEQINRQSNELDYYLSQGAESFPEALSYLPDQEDYKIGPEEYLAHIVRAKEAVGIPIIASLNGVSTGGWIKYAKRIEEAGADALELNVYYLPTDPHLNSTQVEGMYADLVHDVSSSVRIPVAVKIGPFFSAMMDVARKLEDAGADALVLFNRFYQPDFDLEKLEVTPNLVLSRSNELKLRLRWVAILWGHIEADLAVTGGIHTGRDAIKAMMAGAKVAMMTSALLMHGIEHLRAVEHEMREWMEQHEYDTIRLMQGAMSHQNVAHPAAFERANYIRVLGSWWESHAPV